MRPHHQLDGRNIGGEERAERRLERSPASKPRSVLLLRCHVAARAAAGIEHCFSVAEVWRVRRKCSDGSNCRFGQGPGGRCSENHRHQYDNNELSHSRCSGADPPDEEFTSASIPQRMPRDRGLFPPTRLCGALAIGFMATTAVLANFGDLGFEAVEIRRCFRCSFRFGRDFC
jgi:hypothetical protein